MHKFELALENDRWHNQAQFVKFCCEHQNQDIVLEAVNEGHCLYHCGVYEILDLFTFSSVLITTANALEYHPKYQIKTYWNTWLENIKSFDHAFDRDWNQHRIFGCFYGRPSAARLGIAGHLAANHPALSQIVAKFVFDKEEDRELVDLQRLFEWHKDSVKNIFLLDHKKYYHDQVLYDRGCYDQKNPLSTLYKNILIDIVSEPVSAGETFYPTEKIARAILCKRPFIVMASRNYLSYLHQLGFQTFHDFWNEDYDGFDQKTRYIKILQLIDELAAVDRSRWCAIYHAMMPALDHNCELLMNQNYRKQIHRISDDY